MSGGAPEDNVKISLVVLRGDEIDTRGRGDVVIIDFCL